MTEDAPAPTDGGMETSLAFHEGFELPCFASFTVELLGGCRGTDHRHVAEIIAAWDSA